MKLLERLSARSVEGSMPGERIIAVGLLARDLEQLGQSFTRLWPVDETPCFSGLVQAIDEADRELIRERGFENAANSGSFPKPTSISNDGS